MSEADAGLQALYAEALRIRGLNLYGFGQSRNAVQELEHSLSLYKETGETGSVPMLLLETGMVHLAMGDVASAKISYQGVVKIWTEEKNFYYQAEILNNLAVLYHQVGEYELDSETFENGLIRAAEKP